LNRNDIEKLSLKVDHDYCTQCRMCYVACRDLDINAVYVDLEPRHRIEIDTEKCTYPVCTACLDYCPAAHSIVEIPTGRSLVPPPEDVWKRRSLRRQS
jgi:formate hydrogenlyase subunit 6/NADH:ubiquinone oxidoreductase subunit I